MDGCRGEVRRGIVARMPLLVDGFEGSYFDPLLLQPLGCKADYPIWATRGTDPGWRKNQRGIDDDVLVLGLKSMLSDAWKVSAS